LLLRLVDGRRGRLVDRGLRLRLVSRSLGLRLVNRCLGLLLRLTDTKILHLLGERSHFRNFYWKVFFGFLFLFSWLLRGKRISTFRNFSSFDGLQN
jgi:hypothetical protein